MTPKKQMQPGGVRATTATPAEGFAPLLGALRQRIADARQQVLRAVDVVQVQTYRHIGRQIEGLPIRDAVRRELSWTHYRLPSRTGSKAAP